MVCCVNSLWVLENEYGFFAEQGSKSSILVDGGFLYLLSSLCWNLSISGRCNAFFVVACSVCDRCSGVCFSRYLVWLWSRIRSRAERWGVVVALISTRSLRVLLCMFCLMSLISDRSVW